MKSQLTSLGNGLLSGTTVKRRLTILGSGLMLLASFGIVACDETDEPDAQDKQNIDNELGVNFDALGAQVTTCTAADTSGATPVYVASTKTLNLELDPNTDAIVSVVGGKLKVNGYQCRTLAIQANPSADPPVVGVPAVDLTSTNVLKLNIDAASTNKVVIDLLPGTFGNIFGASGGIIVSGNGVAVGVRGSASANIVKMGQESATAFYMELSGDAKPDLKIAGTPGAMTLALGDGADSFSAQGHALVTTSLEGSDPTSDLEDATVTVYGGAGNDTLKGGLGADTLDGGDGNDFFQTSAGSISDGADVYIGGTGTDTVDYSGRTDGVAVSVAPTRTVAWAEGVNLFNVSVASSDTLTYVTATTGTTTARSFSFTAAKTTAANIISDLNAEAVFTVVARASLNDRGELVVETKSGTDSIQLTGGTADLVNLASQTRAGDFATRASDPDDGFVDEGDDVRADVENITGGSGDDTLTGGIGHDTINGGAGADDISGGAKGATCTDDVDVLNGGDGDDVFAMGINPNCGDAVEGGNGYDVADYQMRTAGVTIVVDATANDGEASEADKIGATVELMLGGSGNDTMTGGTVNDDMHGGAGNDLLSGGTGNDTLVGGPGLDTLLGGAGDDYFNETDKVDTYVNSADQVVDVFIKQLTGSTVGSVQADLINGGADFDTCDYSRTATTAMTVTLCSNAAVSNAGGACVGATTDTADQDDITNCDDFVGGAGNDTIIGSDGVDMLNGGLGNDTIFGGAGDDNLIGGGGTDTLNGGAGDSDICGTASVLVSCEI
jgi:Ca2+-binding RTX toxin-like protein